MSTLVSLPETTHPNPNEKMRRYFEKPEDELSILVETPPVCIYFEVTNRCNLLCTTCPRTFEELEPEKDMSWELFTSIVDQSPGLKRAVLHGVGEPMFVKDLPKMVRYLKDRTVYVLFNSNGTLLTEKNGQALIAAGLDELRVSLDAAEPTAFQMVRGKDMFDRIVTNVRRFRQMQREQNVETPRVSLWLTGLRETLDQLEGFVRIAHSVDVREIYLQRMVFFSDNSKGLARAESALFEKTTAEEESVIQRATRPRRQPRHRLQRLRRNRAGHQHQKAPRRFPVVALPPPLDSDVLHRQRPRAPLLHRALLDARLRQLHPRRRLATDPPRNLERPPIPAVSRQPHGPRATARLRQLRPPLEPVVAVHARPHQHHHPRAQ